MYNNLPPDTPLKILFVINPISGGKSKQDWEQYIQNFFHDTIHQIEIYKTTGNNDERLLKQKIDAWQPDKAASIGGDGTLRLCAEALIGKDIPLCVFPAGSANGMARELQMPLGMDECIDVLMNGQAKLTDIIRVNEMLCVHMSDIGINAQLVKYFQANKLRGKLGYAKELLRVLWQRRQIEVKIEKLDETIICTAFMVVVANASTYGTGVRINPMGNLHDGLFEIVILRRLSVIELFKMLFYNRPFNPDKTTILQADNLTVTVKKKAYFQVDGEYIGKTKKLVAKVEKGALLLMSP